MIKKIKGYASGVVAIVLALVILVGFMPCVIKAADEDVVSVSRDRFLTDEIYVYDGRAVIDASQNVIVEFYGNSPSVTMSIDKKPSLSDNSIRIVLDNASLCENMKIDYMYKNVDGMLVTETTECTIVKGNGAREYIVPIKSPATLTSLKLSFEGAASGSVTLISIGTVSHYVDERSYCGTVEKSEFDSITHKASISGSVSWDTVSKNSGAKIVVYRLAQNEKAEDISDPNAYIESREISLHFDISVNNIKTGESYAQYFAAVLTKDGRILPIAPEFYLSFRPNSAGSSNGEVGFKGIDTSLYGGAIEGGSAFAYVDIYLSRFFSYDENGFQYIVDGYEYYVDKDYVSEIDTIINAYRTDGVEVYLRLLVDSDGHGKLFMDLDESDKAMYYSVEIYDESIFSKFTVYAEYVISRYTNESIGNIRGIVLGRAVDLAGIYNYSGDSLTTSEYAEKLAKTLTVLRNILNKYGRDKELILPFSSLECSPDNPLLSAVDGEKYPINVLASSILKYIESYNGSLKGLCFMLEGDSAPIVEEKSDTSVDSGESERANGASSVYAPILQCTAFKNMLEVLSERHAEISTEFVYCWYAGDESAANNYIYNYNIAATVGGVKAFVLSITELGDKEYDVFSELKNSYKFADTKKNLAVGAEAIRQLGFGNWSGIIENFSERLVVKRNLLQDQLKNSVPASVSGSYKMWNYEQGASSSGWNTLYGCDSAAIKVGLGDVQRALAITMVGKGSEMIGAEYGAVVFSQQDLSKVSGISGISFNIFVPKSSQEKIYEILITVESDFETVEFSGVVFCGSDIILYADIEKLDTVRSIKLSSRELSSTEDESYEIYLKGISIHSNRYSDSELEKMALSGNLADSGAVSDDSLERLTLLVVAMIVVFSILILWIIRLAIGIKPNK